MRHAILGVGGVGGLMAAFLAHAGEEVTLLLRPETIGRYPKTLSVQSPFGSFEVPTECATVLAGHCDVVWITVKATQLEDSLKVLGNGNTITTIIPLLNGVDHLALLRSRFGRDRIVPATIAVEAERVSPGFIVQRSPFVRLNIGSQAEPQLTAIIEKLRSFGFTCNFIPDERTLLWSKLVFLAPLALTSTAGALTTDQIMSDPTWHSRLLGCLHEVYSVGTASGAKLDEAQVQKLFAGLPAGMRSSMQKDVAAGRPPELDAIAGPIIRGGQEHGIPAPITRELVDLIRTKAPAAGS